MHSTDRHQFCRYTNYTMTTKFIQMASLMANYLATKETKLLDILAQMLRREDMVTCMIENPECISCTLCTIFSIKFAERTLLRAQKLIMLMQYFLCYLEFKHRYLRNSTFFLYIKNIKSIIWAYSFVEIRDDSYSCLEYTKYNAWFKKKIPYQDDHPK